MNDEIETIQSAPAGEQDEAVEAQAAEDAPVAMEEPDPLVALTEQLARVAEETARYHVRAEQRELVIDKMHAELEQLRRGERRSLLRPLVAEVCRTRDDLVRQAETLPPDFDRDRAAELLRSFAGSLEFALEDNGVDSFEPGVGDPFDPRRHRVAGKSPVDDDGLVGTVESVMAPGYIDTEAGTVISAARVSVYVASGKASPDSESAEKLRENPDPPVAEPAE